MTSHTLWPDAVTVPLYRERIDRTSDEGKQMLIDLARGEVVLAVAPDQSTEGAGWASAFKEMGLPAPMPPLSASLIRR